jgi:hypothetical protein
VHWLPSSVRRPCTTKRARSPGTRSLTWITVWSLSLVRLPGSSGHSSGTGVLAGRRRAGCHRTGDDHSGQSRPPGDGQPTDQWHGPARRGGIRPSGEGWSGGPARRFPRLHGHQSLSKNWGSGALWLVPVYGVRGFRPVMQQMQQMFPSSPSRLSPSGHSGRFSRHVSSSDTNILPRCDERACHVGPVHPIEGGSLHRLGLEAHGNFCEPRQQV